MPYKNKADKVAWRVRNRSRQRMYVLRWQKRHPDFRQRERQQRRAARKLHLCIICGGLTINPKICSGQCRRERERSYAAYATRRSPNPEQHARKLVRDRERWKRPEVRARQQARDKERRARTEVRARETMTARAWRVRNREKERERHQKYKQSNPEKIRASKRAFYRRHAERLLSVDYQINRVLAGIAALELQINDPNGASK